MAAPRRPFGVVLAIEEARANVATTPASLLVAVVAALAAGILVTFTAHETAALQERYDDQVAAGRFVVVVQAGRPDGLDAARCEALGEVEGIVAAGSILRSRTVNPEVLPARPFQVAEATPGAVAAMFPQDPGPFPTGLLSGATAARELGLVDRSWVALATTPATPTPEVLGISRVLAPSARAPELDRRFIAIRPARGRVDSCLVDIDPDHADSARAVTTGWFPPSSQPIVRRLPDAPDPDPTPEDELAGRASAAGFLVAGITMSVIALATWHGRRDEIALYRLLGASARPIVALFAAETAMLVVLPGAMGAALALALSRDAMMSDASVANVTVDLVRTALLIAPLPLVAAAVHLVRSPFETLKGR